MDVTDDLIARAKEKGWPDGLAQRVAAVITPWEIEAWLGPNARPRHELERELDARERTMNGPFHVRELNIRDLPAFAELWAHAPEAIGDWSVTVERSPNPIAQFALHEDCSITVLEERGRLYACTAWSRRPALIGGKPALIHVAHSLRVHEARRGARLADLVRRFPPRATTARPTIAQYMYVRTGNDGVLGFLGAVANQTFGAIGAAGVQSMVTQFPAHAYSGDTAGLRKANREDAQACAALINRTHGAFDLFYPYTGESLARTLAQGFPAETPANNPQWPHVYGWRDYWVLEEAGAIVACGGLWDRGRDMRETWRSKTGETRAFSATNLLDWGYAERREDTMAKLIGFFIGETHKLGRTAHVAPLDRLPALAEATAHFAPHTDARTFEWTPYLPETPRVIAAPYTDLRYW
jgi:hypothetical protein